jgi:hypothetical protein
MGEELKMGSDQSKKFELDAKARGQNLVNCPIMFRTSPSPEGGVGGGPDPSGSDTF